MNEKGVETPAVLDGQLGGLQNHLFMVIK